MTSQEAHPNYSDRHNQVITFRGQPYPGWFDGPAAIWTGGAAPKVIGPFEGVREAMEYQADHAPGSQIFPYYTPDEA